MTRLAWVLALVACGGSGARVATHDRAKVAARVHALADDYVAQYKAHWPELADAGGLTMAHHDAFSDNSLAGYHAWQALEDRWFAEVSAIDPEQLWGTPEWVLLGDLRETLAGARGARVCRSELWPAHQQGWQTNLIILLDQQPVGSAGARMEALARWHQFPRYLDRELDNLREGVRLGYTAPRTNVELAIKQLDLMLAAPENTPLVSPAKRDTDPAFDAQWHDLVANELVPAIRRYRGYLADEYLARARTTIGVSALPDGAACYRAMLRYATTTDVDPQQLFEMGKARVAEREAAALALARELYGADITLATLHDRLEADPHNRFASGDDIVAVARGAVARAEAAAPRYFGRLPKAKLEIKPYAAFEASTHPSARYESAARDGSHPGYFRIDSTNVGDARRAAAEDTAFHEAFPGHHLQISLQQEIGDSHELYDLASSGAYVEGWARYTESLADEMHLYSTPLDRLGAVSGLPTGMVVDPGIHAMGWTREQAIQYTLAKQVGETRESAESYVDRIAIWPAQMVTYGYGELAMLDLRKHAEHELGARFDIRAFHDHVLERGALPLPMLREVIDRWVAEAKRGGAG